MNIKVLRWKNVSFFFSPGAAKSWQASCHRPYQVACSRGPGGLYGSFIPRGDDWHGTHGGNELFPRFLGQRCFEVCFGLITGLFDLDTSYKVVIYAKKPSGWTEKSSFSLIFVIYIWYTLTCIYICIRLATAVLCCGCFCTVLKSLKRREEALQSIELGCVRTQLDSTLFFSWWFSSIWHLTYHTTPHMFILHADRLMSIFFFGLAFLLNLVTQKLNWWWKMHCNRRIRTPSLRWRWQRHWKAPIGRPCGVPGRDDHPSIPPSPRWVIENLGNCGNCPKIQTIVDLSQSYTAYIIII